jgi:hypothetical protein
MKQKPIVFFLKVFFEEESINQIVIYFYQIFSFAGLNQIFSL